jgi:predicted  nucleic acid-binding Zn-ribbon protein
VRSALLGLVLGPGLVALAQAPAVPPEADDWLKVGGAIVTVTGTVLTARHLAEQAKAKAEDAKLTAMAADQRASAIGSKVDDLRRELNDERDRVTQLTTEQRRDQQEITRLRDLRHNYIDQELSPRLQRFENGVEEVQERFGARLAVVEALVRTARSE